MNNTTLSVSEYQTTKDMKQKSTKPQKQKDMTPKKHLSKIFFLLMGW